MATRKITRKVKVVEPDLANPTYTHEWSVEDNINYASINDFYLTYNNVNYYFTKPNTIEIGDKFYFNINTKVLKLNEDTISTSTTGSSNNELSFVPSHKWSDEYINIGANAENVFCSDGKTVEEKLSGLGGDYVEKTGDTMTGPLNTTELTIGSRANETIVGTHSIAIGENTVATGNSSFAQGTSEENASAVITLSGAANTKIYTTNSTTQNIQIGNAITYNNITAYIVSFVPGVSITLDKTLSINSALDSAEVSIIHILSATGECSHAEGHANIASGDNSHAEGSMTAASGYAAHSEGAWTVASGDKSHAEGWQTTASAPAGHAEGTTTTADGESSHAEGYRSRATGRYAHAEGNYTQATVEATHAEGAQTSAIAIGAHAEGLNTIASGIAAHTEGSHTETKSDYAHAEGFYTTAQRKSQHTEGEYNVLDTTGNTGSRGSFVHIVGNGTANNARSNAHTLDWTGNAWYAGDVYVGSTSGVNKDEGSKKLATEEYVNTNGGKIDSISIDGRAQTIDANKNVDLAGLEKTFNKVTSLSDSSTNDQYPSAKAVYDEINTKISTVYKAKGTCTFANKPALNANNEGFVYNISDAFTTTSDFVEGAGKLYPIGTNIVVINNGTSEIPDWKYDVLAGMTDLSGYIKKTGDTMTGSLAIGNTSLASGVLSYAQGRNNIASGEYSFATGDKCEATGYDTSVQGYNSKAIGNCSHAEGYGSVAQGREQHVQGMCNIPQGTANNRVPTDYAHILGNGTDINNLSNAHTITWGGEAWFAGNVYVGSTSGKNKDAGSKKLATEEYVDLSTPQILYGETEPTSTFTAPAGSLYCVYG